MTLRHMRIFVCTFQHSSITKAAEELHLAQPSVSLAVKELEEYYGIRLFERMGRRIYPTEVGKEFYEYALHIVSLFDSMEQRIKNWDTLGVLRVGTSITIGTHILPQLVKQYQQQYPDIRIEVIISNSGDIEEHVLNNTVDLGLIENTPEHTAIHALPFMRDELCAIVPCHSPLANQSSVTLAQLAEFPFLMREKGSAGREILDLCFSMRQLSVHPLWESTSTQAIVKGVEEGIGVAVLPYLLVERDIKEKVVKMLPFQKPLVRDLNVIYHQSKYLTTSMSRFIALCERYGKSSQRSVPAAEHPVSSSQ